MPKLSTPKRARHRRPTASCTASSGPQGASYIGPREPLDDDLAPHAGPAPTSLPRPRAILQYEDAVGIWLRSPMEEAEIEALAMMCDGSRPRIENRKSRFNPDCVQRIVLHRPRPEARAYLTRRNDTHFNYAELATDLIYNSADELNDAQRWLLNHVLVNDRRGQTASVCLGSTRGPTYYNGARGSPRLLVAYARTSKLTKDKHALHMEPRISGKRALAAAGIQGLTDLDTLDALAFFLKHFRFARFKNKEAIAAMGREWNNYWDRQENPQGFKPRRSTMHIPIGKHSTYDLDQRTGHQLIRVLGQFSQEQIALARNAQGEKQDQPGYFMILAACSIQNVWDRLNYLLHMDRYIEFISLDQVLGQLQLRCSTQPI